MTADPTLYLVREGDIISVTQGMSVPFEESTNEFVGAYVSVKCSECGRAQFLCGEYGHSHWDGGSMDGERVFRTLHRRECQCGNWMKVISFITEYPRMFLTLTEIQPEHGCDYYHIEGADDLFSSLRSRVSNYDESVSELLDELERASHTNLVNEDVIGTLESSLNEVKDSLENSVLVLGKFDDGQREVLEDVVLELRDMGYDAELADELPDLDVRTTADESFLLMRMVGFCIMIDDRPSGHNAEYREAEIGNIVLARLFQGEHGSSRMTGESEETDRNHLEYFPYEEHPNERLEDAVQWATDFIESRRESYN